MILFIAEAGGFQGKRSSSKIIPTIDAPDRQPDASVTQQTSHDQVKGNYNFNVSTNLYLKYHVPIYRLHYTD